MDENGNALTKLLKVKLAIGGSIGCASLILILFPLFVVVLFVLGLFDGSGSSGSTCINVKGVDQICSSITVSGYGTMSVDEYVAGVVEHEFGGADIETKKAQAVAARSYGLAGAQKDGSGNCVVSNTSQSFQTYSSNPGETSLQAANETSGIILVDENGSVVSSEYSSCSLQKPYNEFGNKVKMSERDYEILKDMFDKYRVGTACTDSVINKLKESDKDWAGRSLYGSGHGRGMGQVLARYLANEENYTYDQIIEFFYGSESTYNWSLASTNGASSNCTSSHNGNFQTLSTYNLNHDGLKKLNRPLSKSEKDDLDRFVVSEVDKAGYGTGAAVAAAGQALTFRLEQLGYYLGYYWGGGHGADSTVIGFYPNWGKNIGIAYTKSGNPTGPESGMDCSGFVSWAIRNACKSDYTAVLAEDFLGYGKHLKSIADAKPGDVLANKGHVILVVKNNGDNSVTVAEESFGSAGLVFKKYDKIGSYSLVDMSSWYSKKCFDHR